MPSILNALASLKRLANVPGLTKALAAGGKALLRDLASSSKDKRKRAAIALIDRLEQQQGKQPPAGATRNGLPLTTTRQTPQQQEPEPLELEADRHPQMVHVSSSNIHSIGWVPDHPAARIGTLFVRFLAGRRGIRSGEGPLYAYDNVPQSVWDDLYRARSKGTAFWDDVRVRGTKAGHRYSYHLAGLGLEAYIPRQVVLKRGQPGQHFVERQFQGRTSQLRPQQASMRGPPLTRGPGADQLRIMPTLRTRGPGR